MDKLKKKLWELFELAEEKMVISEEPYGMSNVLRILDMILRIEEQQNQEVKAKS